MLPKFVRYSLPVLVMWLLSACTAAAPAATPSPKPIPSLTPLPAATATPTPTQGPTVTPIGSVTTSDNGHTLTLIWTSEFSVNGALGAPVDVAIDPQGNVYVSASNIKKFDSQGRFVTLWGGSGVADGKFNLSTGIAVGPQDNVYIGDFGNNRIQVFDNTGKFLRKWSTNPLTSPASVGVDAQGDVYVNIFDTDGDHVQKFDSSGKLVGSWGATGTGDGQFLGRTEDMALDQHGNVYVTDPSNHRIQKFDPAGKFLAAFGGAESRAGHGLFDQPEGVAVDHEDNIYVADGRFLQKLDANGKFIAQWSVTAGGDLDTGAFLTMDDQDNIYILARKKIIPPGSDQGIDVTVVKKFSQQ